MSRRTVWSFVLRLPVELALIMWELPQSLLGLAVFLLLLSRARRVDVWRGRVMVETHRLGISLGRFVFWTRIADPRDGSRPPNRVHECGHVVQSVMTGPLYLLVIGLPSASRATYAIVHRRRHGTDWTGYYQGYPERWADRLGERFFGVEPPPA